MSFGDAMEIPIYSETAFGEKFLPSPEPSTWAGTPIADFPVYASIRSLENLKNLPQDWDGRGSETPTPEAVDAARWWIRNFSHRIRASGQEFVKPHVSADEIGNVVMEWWRGKRKITVYVSRERAEYVRVWGTRMEEDMQDGDLNSDDIAKHWRWLLS